MPTAPYIPGNSTKSIRTPDLTVMALTDNLKQHEHESGEGTKKTCPRHWGEKKNNGKQPTAFC